MVRFSLLELKGEYDFGSNFSEYKGDMYIGNAKVCDGCGLDNSAGMAYNSALSPECVSYPSQQHR